MGSKDGPHRCCCIIQPAAGPTKTRRQRTSKFSLFLCWGAQLLLSDTRTPGSQAFGLGPNYTASFRGLQLADGGTPQPPNFCEPIPILHLLLDLYWFCLSGEGGRLHRPTANAAPSVSVKVKGPVASHPMLGDRALITHTLVHGQLPLHIPAFSEGPFSVMAPTMETTGWQLPKNRKVDCVAPLPAQRPRCKGHLPQGTRGLQSQNMSPFPG